MGLGAAGLWTLVALQIALTVAALVLAYRQRSLAALALLSGPPLLLLALYIAGKDAAASQLLGAINPLLLAGVVLAARAPLSRQESSPF
jgi:hypothetical protein